MCDILRLFFYTAVVNIIAGEGLSSNAAKVRMSSGIAEPIANQQLSSIFFTTAEGNIAKDFPMNCPTKLFDQWFL